MTNYKIFHKKYPSTRQVYILMLIMSFFILVSFGRINNDAISTIEIIRFGAEPNYHICTDTADKKQIVDNKTERYPMWTRKGCVGWRQQGIVLIEGRVRQRGNELSAGLFRIHVGAGDHAAVYPPERIDIYSENIKGEFLHIAEKTTGDNRLEKKDHWIEVPASLPSNRFHLILRPKGDYLFIDEIEWVPSAAVKNIKPFGKAVKIDDLPKDATQRHQAALRESALMKTEGMNKWLKNVDETKIILWSVEDPFGVIEGVVPQPNYSKTPEVQYHGSASEKESLCFGVAHTGNEPIDVVPQLHGEKMLLDGIKLGLLGSILAADGSIVYDPITPIMPDDSIQLLPNKAAYFWITVDFRDLSAGTHKVDFSIKQSNDTLNKIPFSITVNPWEPTNTHRPFAVNWGYISEKPVCRNPEKCIQDMAEHGINVFVIHPGHIPSPGKHNSKFTKKAALLEKDVLLLKGDGRILLLFLRWDKLLPSEAEAKSWVTWIKTQMESYGLKPSNWALYPVDEPHGKKLDLLVRYANWIKKAEPSVNVYANPIDTKSETVSISDLKKLNKVVDIWQPSIDLVKNKDGRFFNANRTSWWVYQNPSVPAKSASPLRYYRLISWEAWYAGAQGVGFWAYGDTTGSSAWDDFDGRRPDYAVVYENENGPISSRRWEAFRAGVEDFQLLSAACERNPDLRDNLKQKIKDMLNTNANIKNLIDELRTSILLDDNIYTSINSVQ